MSSLKKVSVLRAGFEELGADSPHIEAFKIREVHLVSPLKLFELRETLPNTFANTFFKIIIGQIAFLKFHYLVKDALIQLFFLILIYDLFYNLLLIANIIFFLATVFADIQPNSISTLVGANSIFLNSSTASARHPQPLPNHLLANLIFRLWYHFF